MSESKDEYVFDDNKSIIINGNHEVVGFCNPNYVIIRGGDKKTLKIVEIKSRDVKNVNVNDKNIVFEKKFENSILILASQYDIVVVRQIDNAVLEIISSKNGEFRKWRTNPDKHKNDYVYLHNGILTILSANNVSIFTKSGLREKYNYKKDIALYLFHAKEISQESFFTDNNILAIKTYLINGNYLSLFSTKHYLGYINKNASELSVFSNDSKRELKQFKIIDQTLFVTFIDKKLGIIITDSEVQEIDRYFTPFEIEDCLTKKCGKITVKESKSSKGEISHATFFPTKPGDVSLYPVLISPYGILLVSYHLKSHNLSWDRNGGKFFFYRKKNKTHDMIFEEVKLNGNIKPLSGYTFAILREKGTMIEDTYRLMHNTAIHFDSKKKIVFKKPIEPKPVVVEKEKKLRRYKKHITK